MAKSKQLFRLEGQFLGFAGGRKSPFAYLRLSASPDGQDTHNIKLSKSLRLMLFRYIKEGDWLRVTGVETLDKETSELRLKAQEVLRLTQADLAAPSPQRRRSAKILVCGKSACRKRGAQAVVQQIEAKLANSDLGDCVEVKVTGCMDRCKAGPHVVVNKQRHSRVTSVAQLDRFIDPYLAQMAGQPAP